MYTVEPMLQRHAERTTQPFGLHHPQQLVGLPNGHAALIEAEQHADAKWQRHGRQLDLN